MKNKGIANTNVLHFKASHTCPIGRCIADLVPPQVEQSKPVNTL